MIDSSNTKTMYDAVHQFRELIIQNHGSESVTAQDYIRIADDFQRYTEGANSESSPEVVIQEYYRMAVGVPAFEAPPSKSKERCGRAIRMMWNGCLHCHSNTGCVRWPCELHGYGKIHSFHRTGA